MWSVCPRGFQNRRSGPDKRTTTPAARLPATLAFLPPAASPPHSRLPDVWQHSFPKPETAGRETETQNGRRKAARREHPRGARPSMTPWRRNPPGGVVAGARAPGCACPRTQSTARWSLLTACARCSRLQADRGASRCGAKVLSDRRPQRRSQPGHLRPFQRTGLDPGPPGRAPCSPPSRPSSLLRHQAPPRGLPAAICPKTSCCFRPFYSPLRAPVQGVERGEDRGESGVPTPVVPGTSASDPRPRRARQAGFTG